MSNDSCRAVHVVGMDRMLALRLRLASALAWATGAALWGTGSYLFVVLVDTAGFVDPIRGLLTVFVGGSAAVASGLFAAREARAMRARIRQHARTRTLVRAAAA